MIGDAISLAAALAAELAVETGKRGKGGSRWVPGYC